jgi:hypothetical protein
MPALSVQVAEETIVPAAKRELCHWGRNPNVDPNIPGICLVPESSGVQPAGSEQAGHVPKIVIVYKVNGLVY